MGLMQEDDKETKPVNPVMVVLQNQHAILVSLHYRSKGKLLLL